MSSNIELPELHNWVGLQKVSKQLLPKVEYFMYFIITIVHREREQSGELLSHNFKQYILIKILVFIDLCFYQV